MRASVLIAAHNEGDSLLKTLRACVESVSGLDHEIIVSDDASDDGSVEQAAAQYPWIRVTRSEERLGASPAKHRAAREARGEVLVFLDGHTNPEFGAIQRLVEDVELLAGNAIVTPAVPGLETGRWLNSRSQVGHGYAMRLDTLECRWIAPGEMKVREVKRRRFLESPALIGCALAIGRGLYQELWGFDADMRVWGVEDIDFGLKSWLMGYPVLHDPQAVVGHRFRKSFDNYAVPNEHVVVNQLRFARKHFTSAVWTQWVEACQRRSQAPLTDHPEGLWARAWQLFEEKRASVEQERRYLQSRRKHDEFWYAERFGLAWPRLSGSGTQIAMPAVVASSLLLPSPSPSPSPVKPVPGTEAPCTRSQPVCLCDGECGCNSCSGECLVDEGANAFGECSTQASSGTSVRYVDGQIRLDATDIKSTGFGAEWGHTRIYSNTLSYDGDVGQGYNWLVFQWPYLVPQDDGSIVLVRGTLGSLWFDPVEGGYEARYCAKATLLYDSETNTYTVVLSGGTRLVFHDFVQTTYPAGLFARRVQPGDQVTEVTSYTVDGHIEEVQRSGAVGAATLIESFLYTYTVDGQVETALLRRKLGAGSWDNVRRSVYDYYGLGSSFGSLGDLQRVRVQALVASTWTDLESTAYRYYLDGDPNGFAHGLKYVINPLTYARMVGASLDPLTETDSVVADWADHFYEFDSERRVVLTRVEGGTEETVFSYTVPDIAPTGYNGVRMKTTVTLPDGSQMKVFTNKLGQILLIDTNDGGGSWLQAYQYECSHLVQYAHPSAVAGYYFEPKSNTFFYTLSSTDGLIDLIEYYTGSGSGAAPGYVKYRKVQQGSGGTPVLVQMYEYTSVTAGDVTIYPVAKRRVYRNDDGSGEIDTDYAYTYYSGTVQIAQVTTTLPTVTTAQNGPNTAATPETYYDEYCRQTWTMDEQGFLNYTDSDLGTGAVTKTIVDVDSTASSEYGTPPPGWTIPTSGGLNLMTLYEIDNMGRVTMTTAPNGRVDFAVFKDADHETRYYPGWDSGTDLPTGPTQVRRQDRALNYGESLTMSATPDVSGGRPTGNEAIDDVQSLSRGLFNQVGQLIYQDQYFDLTGVPYSTTPTLGTAGTNYYRTAYTYDDRDRVVRTLTPQGTIQRTVYDFLNRTLSQWTGTNDSPASGDWSPTNNTSPANMVQTAAYEYDNGGVGDNNLTQSTAIPSGVLGSADDRVTQTWFDWRNRSVATKAGVQVSEATDVHRPISYVEYDNLSRVVLSQSYDGDGVTITVTGGVPDAPSSSLLRAQSETLYDERGRVYRSLTYSVDPSSGTVSTDALTTNSYYDQRGNTIATSSPGGLWSKAVYDGAGRTTTSYSTDGATGTSWANAGSIASDHVLEQSETVYDPSGNVLQTATRQRFDDTTGTGALGTPTSGNHARVYYQGYYYDLADRITDSVNVGTNTISGTPTAWTRPGSVPSRSDTVLVNSTSYDDAGRVLDGTDPKALVLRSLYDLAGRTTTTIEDYTGSTPTDDADKTTQFAYNSAGTTALTAVLAGGTDHQTTGWLYGVTTGTGSDLDSEDVAATTQYPDPTSGDPSSGQEEVITVNALGQTLTALDRNGTVHTYSYDVLGRLTLDAVTTLGSGVDGSVLARQTAYDTQGNAYLFTTWDDPDPGSGSIVNQVQREFNGLGQLITEYQEHSGAVNTSTSPKVQYAYVEMAGGANNSRITTLTYPNSRVVSYNYASGLDTTISRLTSMKDGTDALESYTYLGLGTVVRRSHMSNIDLSYIKLTGESNGDAGDKYTGLDRFGRVVDQRWLNGSNADVDRYQYAYDRNSNRQTRSNVLNSSFDEVYTYDDLNQISTFDRGSSTLTQSWEYDAVGNWARVWTNSVPQRRFYNRLNEITGFDDPTPTPVYDANGNMTQDEQNFTYSYDAWNMAVTVQGDKSTNVYVYDALSRRVQSGLFKEQATDLYYSVAWQVLEERVENAPVNQYVWSLVYIDCMVCRNSDTELTNWHFPTQDANFNTTALFEKGGSCVERYAYTPFGSVSYYDPSWTSIGSSAYNWIYLHQGGRLDPVSGLYYFRNRDYSPTLGRWMATDPIGFGGGDENLYRYLANDPVQNYDPMGLELPYARFGCRSGGHHCHCRDCMPAPAPGSWGGSGPSVPFGCPPKVQVKPLDPPADPCLSLKEILGFFMAYEAYKKGWEALSAFLKVVSVYGTVAKGGANVVSSRLADMARERAKAVALKAVKDLAKGPKEVKGNKEAMAAAVKFVATHLATELAKAAFDLNAESACKAYAQCRALMGEASGKIARTNTLNREIIKCEWENGKVSYKVWGLRFATGWDKWEGV